ncbi:MAG TPA: hypothetical protein VH372_09680 [Actinospica sp.]|nr:hypothetical protein [Actinospica sp.]
MLVSEVASRTPPRRHYEQHHPVGPDLVHLSVFSSVFWVLSCGFAAAATSPRLGGRSNPAPRASGGSPSAFGYFGSDSNVAMRREFADHGLLSTARGRGYGTAAHGDVLGAAHDFPDRFEE